MTRRLCTDSSALLAPAEAKRLAVEIVPVEVVLDGVPLDADADAFYERLAAGALATTSQPSPGAFAAAYDRLARDGATEIVSLHLDARFSGTVASAELAAREAALPVTVLDTGTASYGVALCVRAAAAAGDPVIAVRELASRLRNVFVAADAPDGRLEGVSGWNVHELAGGSAVPVARCDSPADAVAVMADLIAAGGAAGAAVGHAAASTLFAADALAARLAGVPVERYRIEPPVGAHSGPFSFGAFWWTA